ncbi:MAG TPA: hypothetical protein VFO16_07890, partial [Pseudonocardiaceae bacterium]|nr:hypothetical protein [Pseudonocardiaceae bacterium]
MAERLTRLDLSIEAGPGADLAESAALAIQLREWLLLLDIESAELTTAGQAPPRTRSGGMFITGALTAMLTRSSELFSKLIDTVRTWLSHSGARSVRLEID